MVKCEAIKQFTLRRFGELQNIQRSGIDRDGELFVGDTFECSQELADYLLGNNNIGLVAVKVLEIIPEIVEPKIEKPIEKVEPKIKATKTTKPKTKKSIKK